MRLGSYRNRLRHLLHPKEDRLPSFLRGITELMDAQGCALWGIFPKPKSHQELRDNPHRFRLFTVASWFKDSGKDEFFGYAAVPVAESNIGAAIMENRAVGGYDPANPSSPAGATLLPRPLRKHAMIDARGINYMCGAPLYHGDNVIGGLSVYRCGGPSEVWFSSGRQLNPAETEEETLQDIALLVPSLYDSIIKTQQMRVIEQVDDVLKTAEMGHDSKSGTIRLEDAKRHLETLCERVAAIFRCSEVSLFMEPLDKLSQKGVIRFNLMATTWKNGMKRESYDGSKSEGLTGWVLERGDKVWIPDLRNFARDKAEHHKTFAELEHKNALNLPFGDGQLPISFMAAPLKLGDRVLGAIRCTSLLTEPRHYTEDDAEALLLAGSLLATVWHSWQSAAQTAWERARWERFLSELDGHVHAAHTILKKDGSDTLSRIFEELLNIVPKFVDKAGRSSVHLLDTVSGHLVQTVPAASRQLLDGRFRIGQTGTKPKSIAEHVFRSKTQKAHYFPDVKNDQLYAGTIDAAVTTDMITCQIALETSSGAEPMGVLSIRSGIRMKNPEFTQRLAATLALQIALFSRFHETIEEARRRTDEANTKTQELERQGRTLQRVFEDIRHQIKAPLDKALFQLSELSIAARDWSDAAQRKDVRVINGLCRKASGVARSLKLLAAIEARRPLKLRKERLDKEEMGKLCAQMGEDHEMEAEPEAPVWFSADAESISKIPWRHYAADKELLEQVLFCLCDNALKYSFPRSRVEISARTTKSDQLCITVSNRGTRVSLEESKRVLKRGERGWAAKLFRGEGSGIGLYLVHQIIDAHGGEFRLIPTDSDGITIAEILLPRESATVTSN